MTTRNERTLGAVRRGCVFLSAIVAAGCAQDAAFDVGTVGVALDTTRGANAATVVVGPLPNATLDSWRKAPEGDHEWRRTFRMTVKGNDSAPIEVKYAVSDTALEIKPTFPFDRGRSYELLITQPFAEGKTRRVVLALPQRTLNPTTQVTRILPDLAVLPENQLRMYVEFSAPMGREAGLAFVQLREAGRDSVGDAFLPVDGDFWNPDRTRYTLFLDPGRVKRGILPNEEMGRPLTAGRRYELRVDSAWRDANGLPLTKSFTYSFRAGAAELRPLALRDWTIRQPAANTREALVVRFPRPLDHGLLRRALGVENITGAAVVADAGRQWQFVPDQPWNAGTQQLIVLSILEDLAGNRINRAFEADRFDVADSTSTTPRFTIPFIIR